jgi:hypothetical protein
MSGYKSKISLIIGLVLIFSGQVFSQRDSLAVYNSQNGILKPQLHYSIGSTFLFVPHLGSVSGVNFSPVLSIPLSPKLTFDGGIMAGRYYSSLGNIPEGGINRQFNEISVFGSASYRVNSQLTLYGTGIKQVAGSSPFYLPQSSYTIGSDYKFGSFSIGVSMQMSKWGDNRSPFPFNNAEGFYSPYAYPQTRRGGFYTNDR